MKYIYLNIKVGGGNRKSYITLGSLITFSSAEQEKKIHAVVDLRLHFLMPLSDSVVCSSSDLPYPPQSNNSA